MGTNKKALSTVLLLAIFLWSPQVSAEYCKTNASTDLISCRYSDHNGKPHNASLTISYTRQGWSMMIAIFVDDWLMLEGDASIQMGDDKVRELKYITSHKDLTEQGALMEAVTFLVSEELLLEMQSSKGTFRITLPAKEADDLELKFWAKRYKKLDKFIAETKAALGI
jgi:hypothetical protein